DEDKEKIFDHPLKVDPSKMKWGELKSYAKEQGINTKGMKKAEILEALK
ncbi:unnamed protein product, partial [marine sediment metagenome]